MANRVVGTPGNIAGQAFLGFAVGDEEFLSSEASRVAKYWRLVEFGSEGFIGKLIGGLWSDDSDRGGELSTFGVGRQQQFVSFGLQGTEEEARTSAIKALGYLAAHHQLKAYPGFEGRFSPFQEYRYLVAAIEAGATSGPTIGVVKQEFKAMDAYQQAAAKFRPAVREAAAIHQVFQNMNFFTERGSKKSVLTQRTGSRAGARTGSVVGRLEGAGFLKAIAITKFNQSLGDVVDAQLRRELTAANRLLAEALAVETAEQIKKSVLRKQVSKDDLVEATVQPQNRFPN